jgi:hypothetical protein
MFDVDELVVDSKWCKWRWKIYGSIIFMLKNSKGSSLNFIEREMRNVMFVVTGKKV